MKRQLFLILIALGLAACAHGQTADTTKKAAPAKGPLKVALGIQVGSMGPGLSLAFQYFEKWNFRLTGTYIQANYNENNTDLKYLFESTVRVGGVGVYADWFPFNKARGVGFTAGLAYSFIKLDASGRSLVGYQSNDFAVTAEEIGTISTSFYTNPVMPYLGLGFGRSVPNKVVNFRFELGAYYMGSPKVDMTATGLVHQTTEERDKIQDNLKNYMFYPSMTFNLNFKLTKP